MRDCVNLTLQNGPDVPGHSWIRFQVMNKDVISCDDLNGKVASHLVPFFLFPSGKPQAVKGKRIVGSVEKTRGPKRRRDPPEPLTDHCNLRPLRRAGPRKHGHDPRRDPEPGGRQRYKGSGAAERAENLQLQIWPIYGTIWGVTCNVSKVGHQVTSLTLLHCLGLPYWHYQLVLSWYLH